jgi:hypothetical protein
LAFDKPESDPARNALYNAAYSLAVQQTGHEIARLASLVSAQYGNAAWQKLYNSWTNIGLTASTTAGTKGTTLVLGAKGLAGTASAARFYRDTDNNGILDTSVDEYLGQVITSAAQCQRKLLNCGTCIGTNTYFAIVRNAAGIWSPPSSVKLNIAKGTLGTPWIIDDEGASFTMKGKWNRKRGTGYAGDQVYPASGTGNTATWTYTGLLKGVYQVSITWGSAAGAATNVPYAVYDGKRKLASFSINQTQKPLDFKSAGASWRNLGNYTVSSGQLRVSMSDLHVTGRAYADAVRISLVKANKSSSSLALTPTGSNTARAPLTESAMPAIAGLIQPAFDWSMPARYDPNENRNGRIDLHNG